jgi:hypothetical protein
MGLPCGPRDLDPPDRAARLDVSRLDEIAPAVEAAIRDKKLPGAVALIGRGDRVVYQQAFGSRAPIPPSTR